jgi:hypothetical protein
MNLNKGESTKIGLLSFFGIYGHKLLRGHNLA